MGLRPWNDGVAISAGRLRASYGLLPIETPLSNVAGTHVTGNDRWWTAIGVRLSFVDDGLTFGTNRDAGVCVHPREKVPSLLGPGGHSALTVTVGDLEGVVQASTT